MKPICCGDRRDAKLLLAAGSEGLTIDEINPVWLKTPVAAICRSSHRTDADRHRHILAALRALQSGLGVWLSKGLAAGSCRFVPIIL
jgi:dethiobiotin synthetase